MASTAQGKGESDDHKNPYLSCLLALHRQIESPWEGDASVDSAKDGADPESQTDYSETVGKAGKSAARVEPAADHSAANSEKDCEHRETQELKTA